MMSTTRTAGIDGDKDMPTNRQAATIVGVCFILATVTAILGGLFYQPMLTDPDYLINGAGHTNQVVLGALMELVLVCTAIGTAIGLFPVLRPYGERIALGHLCFRFLEAVVITIGIVAVLSLLTLSQDFVAAAAPDASAFLVAGTLLHAVKAWTFMLGPGLMLGVNTALYSYLLYQSRLVPRWIAGLGLIGAALVLSAALLQLLGVLPLGSVGVVLLAMPVAAYEMILAVWLIVKGFNPAAIASTPARTGRNEILSPA